ncbi:MAG: signal recognition particle protein [Alphaproteobacteria bacterium]|nr:signal recognition particle protein [Alphaproteobacteria bacterium]
MFESLTGKLGDIFDGLTRRGALSEADIDVALREVRVALLEADVALPVVKQFIDHVRVAATGETVLKSVTPGQQMVKIVHDQLVEMLGGEAVELNLRANPPVPILMVGLQGSGKTTTTAKVAVRLAERQKSKVLMAALDTRRPAAQQQLAVLGEQAGIDTLPIVAGEPPVAIARRAVQKATLEAYDVLLLDTAGRLAIDDELMDEAAAIRDATNPVETLLVADAMTGQDAVNVARAFGDRVGLTGIVLTRVDGDARGGAALSMRMESGCPIKLIGVGEKLDALEAFHPERIAGRILGMGDIVGLVEKAQETIEQEEAEKLARKVQKGDFDLDDMAQQLQQMRKMGGLEGLLGMMPGVGKVKKQLAEAKIDDGMIRRQEAIISSMTKQERRSPKVIHASRRRRIAAGSGTTVQEVNKLLKQHLQMTKMMKRMGKLGKKGMMRGMAPGGLPPGFGGM